MKNILQNDTYKTEEVLADIKPCVIIYIYFTRTHTHAHTQSIYILAF